MNELQLLMLDLENWNKRAATYSENVQNLKRELIETDKTLNDLAHLRENYNYTDDTVSVLKKIDLREQELRQVRRSLKSELQHYDKCRSMLNAVIQQVSELLEPSNHTYGKSYQLKTQEGRIWADYLDLSGLKSKVRINPPSLVIPTENLIKQQVPSLIQEKSEEVQKSNNTLAMTLPPGKAPLGIQILRLKKQKQWVAKDIKTGKELSRNKKLKALVIMMTKDGTKIINSPKEVQAVVKKMEYA